MQSRSTVLGSQEKSVRAQRPPVDMSDYYQISSPLLTSTLQASFSLHKMTRARHQLLRTMGLGETPQLTCSKYYRVVSFRKEVWVGTVVVEEFVADGAEMLSDLLA